MQLNIGWFSYR